MTEHSPYSGDSVEVLVKLEPVEGCGLSCTVQSQHDHVQRGLGGGQGVQEGGGALPHVRTHLMFSLEQRNTLCIIW